MSEQTKTAEQTATDQFETIESQRGEVKILNEPGESIEGIYTQKEGRKIGDYESKTLELFSPEQNKLFLVPMNIVLEGKVNATIEKRGDDYHFLRITYLGKKDGSENTYRDYKLQRRDSTQDEVTALGQFEQENA